MEAATVMLKNNVSAFGTGLLVHKVPAIVYSISGPSAAFWF